MALWQFVLCPIPANRANVAGIDAIHLSREHLDGVDLRLSVSSQDALCSAIARLPEDWGEVHAEAYASMVASASAKIPQSNASGSENGAPFSRLSSANIA